MRQSKPTTRTVLNVPNMCADQWVGYHMVGYQLVRYHAVGIHSVRAFGGRYAYIGA